MDHAPLDRTGSHNGDFHDQVVEAAGQKPRQHAHLRPAFDLKDTDRIGAANHVVDRLVFGGHGAHGHGHSMVLRKQAESLANGGQHSQSQTIDFQDAESFHVVLVPLDDRPLGHGRIFKRHQLGE